MLLVATVAALAAFTLGIEASAAPSSSTTGAQTRLTFCGQIRNGPANDWSMPPSLARQLGLPARMRGRTWTVYSRGTPCAFALRNTRLLLRPWAKTRPGERIRYTNRDLRAWICGKDRLPAGSRGSPGASCIYLGIGSRFGFVQLGPLTLAQIKELAAKGRLPVG